MKSNWGPPQVSMRWLYTFIVRPGKTYGCLVWRRTVMNKYQAEQSRVQGLALMLQGLFRQNTPRRSLELLSAVEPLHLFIHNQMLKSAYRNSNHIISLLEDYPHTSISDLSTIKYIANELKALGIPLNPTLLDRKPKIRVHERAFSLNTDALNIRWPKINIENVNMFTDGSLLQGKRGYGALIENEERSNSRNLSQATVPFFYAKFKQLSRAKRLIEEEVTKRSIHYFVDSQAAIQALVGDQIRSKTVFKAITLLNDLGSSNNIVFNWVKAHNKHATNDRTDELAKAGALSEEPWEWIPVPDAFVKRLIDEERVRRWNYGWSSVEGHRQTKLFFPVVDCS